MINEVDEVLTVPLAATVEIEDNIYCWVENAIGVEQRLLKTKPGDDVSLIVESGIRLGEKVIMNPLIYTEAPKVESETEVKETSETSMSGS